MYIVVVYRSPPLVNAFYACLTIIPRRVQGEWKTETVYLTNIYLN